MTVEEKIYGLLSAGATAALVPAARIKVPGDWQDLASPYVVHHPAVPEQTLHTHDGGLQPLRIWPYYQISIFAASYSQARTISQAVIADLDGYVDGDVQTIWYQGMRVLDYDTDRKIQHIALDFEVGGTVV